MEIKLINIFFYLLVFSFVLPSGSVVGIPVKMLLVLGLFVVVIWNILVNKETRISKYIVQISIIIAMLFIWAILGIINNYEDGLMPIFKSLFSLLSVIFLAEICISNQWIDIKFALQVVKMGVICFVGLKIAIELALIIHVIDLDTCTFIMSNILNAEWLTLQFQVGPLTMHRISTPNDAIPLILYSIDLACENKRVSRRMIEIALMAFYCLIVYSRVIIVQFVIMTVIGLAFHFRKHEFTKRDAMILLFGIVAILGLGVMLVTYKDGVLLSHLYDTLAFRFSGEQVEYSDSFRTEQAGYLLEGIIDKPLIGHGLGSYVREYLRSYISPSSYELEYMAFLYQFGIIGFVLIIIGMIVTFYQMSVKQCEEKIAKQMLMINLFIWAIKPTLNPGFLSSSSGMVIVTFMIIALYYNHTSENRKVGERHEQSSYY